MASYNISNKTTEFSGSSHDSSQFSSHRTRKNVLKFKAFLKTLPKEEQDIISEILHNYRLNRNVYYLAQALKTTCDPTKRLMIIPLLKLVIPASDRAAFDQFTCDELLLTQMASHAYSNRTMRNSSYESSPEYITKNNDGSTLCRSIKRVKSKNVTHLSRSSSLTDLYENRPITNGTVKEKRSPGRFGSTLRKKVSAVLNDKKSTRELEKEQPKIRSNLTPRFGKKQQKESLPSRSSASSLGQTSSSSDTVTTIDLFRASSKENDLGFIIGGGKELGTGIFVSHVEVGSIADLAGLKQGDMIVKVNGIPFHSNLPHVEAAAVLKKSKRLSIQVIQGGAKKLMNTTKSFAWIDASCGQPISPPSDDETSSKLSGVRSYNSRSGMRLPAADERKINISIKPNQKFGVMIRGGSEYGIGIYVTGVDPGSVADHAGLKIGDQILEVNGFRFEGISHAEAVNVIKSSHMLILTVKYAGKIPQEVYRSSRKPKSDVPMMKKNLMMSPRRESAAAAAVDLSPNNSSPLGSEIMSELELMLTGDCDSKMVMIERENLLTNVCKYSSGHISVQELAQSLDVISKTDDESAQIIPLVRDIIRNRDVSKFDTLTSKPERQQQKSSERYNLHHHHDDHPPNSPSSSKMKPKDSPPPPPTHPSSSQDTTPPPPQSSVSHRAELLAKIAAKKPASPLKPKRKTLTKMKAATDYSVSTEPEQLGLVMTNEHDEVLTNHNHDADSDDGFSIATRLQQFSTADSDDVESLSRDSSPSHYSRFLNNKQSSAAVSFDKNFKPSQLLSPKRKQGGISIGRFKKAVNNKKSLESIHFYPPAESTPKPADKADDNCGEKSISSRTSSSASSSPASKDSLNDPDSWAPPPPSRISFRTSSFGSTAKSRAAVACEKSATNNHHQQQQEMESHQSSSPDQSPSKSSQDNSSSDKSILESSKDSDASLFKKEDVELQKMVIFRVANTLGLTIEGGAGTEQPLPRIRAIQEGSCAHRCTRLQVGHVVHAVNNKSLEGLSHHSAVGSIARAFKNPGRDSLELIVSGPYE